MRYVSLSAMPEIEAYVESIRATLDGDLTALRHFYNVALEGMREAGAATGSARAGCAGDGPADRDFRQQNRIGEIDVYQTDGDRSSMTITPDPCMSIGAALERSLVWLRAYWFARC